MSLSSRTASWRTGLLLSLLSLTWIALLAWLTHRSWFMTDDAFISFRYAANLIEGNGLTFIQRARRALAARTRSGGA